MIQELLLRDLAQAGELSDEDIRFVAECAGPMDGHTLDDEDEWDDTVLEAYKNHLFNYLYKYKPEAKQIDPRIDPNEQQIGIMAQDLEKVNPACVKEVNGVKTVDTEKLALMNAGAIADIVRRLDKLEAIIGRNS